MPRNIITRPEPNPFGPDLPPVHRAYTMDSTGTIDPLYMGDTDPDTLHKRLASLYPGVPIVTTIPFDGRA